LVIDGTRKATLEQALDLQRRMEEIVGAIPFIVVLNKADLTESWQIDRSALAELENRNWRFIQTSAKLGTGVEEAFAELGQKILTTP
jgi:50S ribosomal subunit-associated GTPase HflX